MARFKFFELEQRPHGLHIGRRMIKTVIAVMICGLIGALRGRQTFYSMIAAVLCLQNSKDQTILFSLNRALGTLIGFVYGVFVLYAAQWMGLEGTEPLYYVFVSLVVIPDMLTAIFLRKPSVAGFSCVVLFSITVAHVQDESPFMFALGRVLDTGIGLVAATVIDLIIPWAKPKDEPAEEPADKSGDDSEHII